MRNKRPAKAPAKVGAKVLVRWDFGDKGVMTIPLAEMEQQLMRQYHLMSESDDPLLREAGRRKLAELSKRLEGEQIRRIGSSKGGSSNDAPAWHSACIKRAKSLLAAGTAPREVAGKLAQIFQHDPKTIRGVLRKAGIK